ncbi:MAG: DUF1641 domain-containing protein [Chloroflexota bacterium]|nr:DUF1641 domain-containing protein [Chloroflexota bacterium]MBI5704421.1 DUF1641 domain-containing protein [Chloroflexota bacterium]
MDNELAQINQKLDYLMAQFEAQRESQQAMRELMDDAVPIVNHVIKLSIDELAEVGNDFQLGDLLFLVKRLLRDTRLLVGLLDQLESMAELAEEGQRMGKRIFHQVTMELDRLEREGYFGFARAGIKIADRLVHDHKPEELEALGNRLAEALKTEPPKKVSLFALLKAMGDPKVRRGLYRSLNLLKAIGD